MSLSFSFIQQWQEVGAAKCGVGLFRGTGSVFSGRVGCLKRWRHLYSEMIHFIGAKASKLTPQVHSQFLAHSKVLAKHSNRPTDDFSRGASAAEIIFALDEEVASAYAHADGCFWVNHPQRVQPLIFGTRRTHFDWVALLAELVPPLICMN